MPHKREGESVKQREREEGRLEKTETEEKLEHLLSGVEGVGKAEVMLMTEERGNFGNREPLKITGVLVSAQGGDDPETVQKIMEAVQALFQVEPHKIRIMKRK